MRLEAYVPLPNELLAMNVTLPAAHQASLLALLPPEVLHPRLESGEAF